MNRQQQDSTGVACLRCRKQKVEEPITHACMDSMATASEPPAEWTEGITDFIFLFFRSEIF